ncbi:MAG TPA: OB-fold nucleic acid binding domain-containing protein, partial [Gammaproteobacteria bacterium]
MSDNKPQAEPVDENKLIAERRAKLQQMREKGMAFPNDFRRNVMAGELHAKYGTATTEELEANPVRVTIAGRVMLRRIMGKASFVTLKDMSGTIQLFVQKDSVGEE